MTSTAGTAGWVLRAEPLTAAAAWATGPAGRELARAAAERVRAGAALRCALDDDDGCLVVGADHDLPWVPGVGYLGLDGGALVSTTHAPTAPVDLLRRAVQQRHAAHHPVALVVLAPDLAAACPRPEATADPLLLEHWAQRP